MKANEIKRKRAEIVYEQLMRLDSPILKPFPKGLYFKPYNFATEKTYGGNDVLIDLFPDSRFAGFKQISDRKETLKKGCKAIPIFFPIIQNNKKEGEAKTEQDTIIREIEDYGKGEKNKEENSKTKSLKFGMSYVFNISDVADCKAPSLLELAAEKGLLAEKQTGTEHLSSFKNIDTLVQKMGVQLEHITAERAYYSPMENVVRMQFKEMYSDLEDYYKTLLHEVSHWSRKNIESLHREPSKELLVKKAHLENKVDKHHDFKYVREEFAAEITAYFLTKQFGFPQEKDSQSYLKNYMNGNSVYQKEDWLDIIEDALDAANKTKKHFLEVLSPEETKIKLQGVDVSTEAKKGIEKGSKILTNNGIKDQEYEIIDITPWGEIIVYSEETGERFPIDKKDIIELNGEKYEHEQTTR